ncbi:MAG: hypothetical protein ABIP71_12415, partial [Verrucomicrobiota bacterium]
MKKHYEKILLSFVLLCLAITAVWFYMKINAEKESSQQYIITLPKPKELPPLDLTTNQATLLRLQNPPTIEFAGAHNLFNSVTWKLKPDGTFLKIVREGVDALTVTKIVPLYLELSYDRAAGTGYWIGTKRHSVKKPAVYAKLNEKKEAQVFKITGVKGPAEDPEELVLELTENQQVISISKAKPFQRVESYAADLRYEPDNKNFPNQHVN